MAMKGFRIAALSVLLMAGGLHAWAEDAAPSESVTVSGTRMRREFQNFLRGFAAPTDGIGKYTRWKRRICPAVTGQDAHTSAFIAQRIQYVAMAAGAKINTDPACKPNIEVIFTTTPQALLDDVRRHHVVYLGYAETNSEVEKLARVTRPVQAWYATEIENNNGQREFNTLIRANNDGNLMFDPSIYGSGGAYGAEGGRIRDGLQSNFFHILIVVDSSKMGGQEIVPLADYISLLALTELKAPDACQDLTTVANLMAPGCSDKVEGLTKYDLAYLQGLYLMGAGRNLMFQRNDIASVMTDRLLPQK